MLPTMLPVMLLYIFRLYFVHESRGNRGIKIGASQCRPQTVIDPRRRSTEVASQQADDEAEQQQRNR